MDCPYCMGLRAPCSCAKDCGARPASNGHHCPQAPDYIDYLRSTGLYSDAELQRLTTTGLLSKRQEDR
jgi:hypothetical protein